jgi:radical SAM superfamily enzyme YgiQ (UPF0313 family)
MKALLVYPEYPDTFWSFKYALKFVSKKAAFPPLGLLTVASLLPDAWEKKLVDMNVEELKDEHLAWADLVYLGAMLVQSKSAAEIIRRCKKSGKKTVAGGPLFTTRYQQFPDIDHFVLNEAEITLPLFLSDLADGQPRPLYQTDRKPDITRTPIPLWSLIDMKNYATMLVQYSRGCPYNCEFCDIVIMNGRIPRTKTPEQMIREFEVLFNAGWRKSVFIVDDNFIGNKKKVKEMLPVLADWQKKHGYPFPLLTEASVDLARDGELMQLMSRANFFKVFLGVETPNTDSLNECDKQQNTSSNLTEAVNRIHRHGMQVMGGFIVGFDSDPENIFEMQMKFIQQLGIVTAMVGLLTALPQTRLWHRLKKEGRLLSDASGENTDGFLNFQPIMDREKLLNGYRKLLTNLYSQKYYYQRINTFLKNYRPTVNAKINREDMLAFLRSTWQLGIKSKARFRFWKLLAKTLLLKRKAVPMAVELAIIGLHFEQILKRLHIPRAIEYKNG